MVVMSLKSIMLNRYLFFIVIYSALLFMLYFLRKIIFLNIGNTLFTGFAVVIFLFGSYRLVFKLQYSQQYKRSNDRRLN